MLSYFSLFFIIIFTMQIILRLNCLCGWLRDRILWPPISPFSIVRHTRRVRNAFLRRIPAIGVSMDIDALTTRQRIAETTSSLQASTWVPIATFSLCVWCYQLHHKKINRLDYLAFCRESDRAFEVGLASVLESTPRPVYPQRFSSRTASRRASKLKSKILPNLSCRLISSVSSTLRAA